LKLRYTARVARLGSYSSTIELHPRWGMIIASARHTPQCVAPGQQPGGRAMERDSIGIAVNGVNHRLEAPLSVAALLERLDMAGRRVAVEVNQAIVPRSAHGRHLLADGDVVELVQAIGGG